MIFQLINLFQSFVEIQSVRGQRNNHNKNNNNYNEEISIIIRSDHNDYN